MSCVTEIFRFSFCLINHGTKQVERYGFKIHSALRGETQYKNF